MNCFMANIYICTCIYICAIYWNFTETHGMFTLAVLSHATPTLSPGYPPVRILLGRRVHVFSEKTNFSYYLFGKNNYKTRSYIYIYFITLQCIALENCGLKLQNTCLRSRGQESDSLVKDWWLKIRNVEQRRKISREVDVKFVEK